MTKVIDGVNVLTYDEWAKLPGAKTLLGEVEECDECDGTGEHECSCGHTHECVACDGSGKDGGVNLRDIYEETLRDEIKKLIAWREGLATKRPSFEGERQRESVNAVKIHIHGNGN
ncbi:MAG: hypothetical protein PHQ36_12970 [Anaerolineales bacterium]|nr:hypothetical protein [Anaerolineales bacterium]